MTKIFADAEALYQKGLSHSLFYRWLPAYKAFEAALASFEELTAADDPHALWALADRYEKASDAAYNLYRKGKTAERMTWLNRANSWAERGATICDDALRTLEKSGERLPEARFNFLLRIIRLSGNCTLAGRFEDGVKWGQRAMNVHFALGQMSHTCPRDLWPLEHRLIAEGYIGCGDQYQAMVAIDGALSSVTPFREKREEVMKEYAELCTLKVQVLSMAA